MAEAAGIPLVLAQLLATRGIVGAAEANQFLHPAVNQLFDPFLMLGMAQAVGRLEQAIASREPILLYGDYDVDGTTAVVLLKTAIEILAGARSSSAEACDIRFHVPHRLKEGYGLQSSVLEEHAAQGVRLVITVDTGMRAFAEAETARRLGLDLIITDHHLPDAGDAIPVALAILNPNQPGCPYPEKSLCGAAIAFKLAQALLERWDRKRAQDKILPSFLKMVAIATVADAVPLRGENRVLAAVGIQELHRPAGAGLKALFAAAGLDPTTKPLTSFDLGFRLGPRINAAGRMDVAKEVVELFTTRDSARASELAAKLEQLNLDRRETEAEVLSEIEDRLASNPDLEAQRIVVMAGEGWHRGIIGILASRIVDRTAKPAIVISIEEGIAYGSGRSVDGFPLLASIETCADLFTRFGGHAFAVGFALPANHLPELERRLLQFAAAKLSGQPVRQLLRIHQELPINEATEELSQWIERLEPYGHSNPEPIFLARQVRLAAPIKFMKERHIRLTLSVEQPGQTSRSTQAVGWNLATRAQELALTQGSRIDLAYRIRQNDHPQFGGLQLEIAGIRLASPD